MADAIADVLGVQRPRDPLTHDTLRWIDAVTTPPQGAEIVTGDGSRITGLALIYDNKVVRTLALRELRDLRAHTARVRGPAFDPEYYADEGELWGERGQPWRR